MDALAIDLDVSAGRGNGLADRHFAGIDVDGLGRDARDAIPVGPGKIHVPRADFFDFRDGQCPRSAGRTDRQIVRTVCDDEILVRLRGNIGCAADGNLAGNGISGSVRIDEGGVVAGPLNRDGVVDVAGEGRSLDIEEIRGFGLRKRQSGLDSQCSGLGLRQICSFGKSSFNVVDGDVASRRNDILVGGRIDDGPFGDVAGGGERDVVAGDGGVDLKRVRGGFQANVAALVLGGDGPGDRQLAGGADADVASRGGGGDVKRLSVDDLNRTVRGRCIQFRQGVPGVVQRNAAGLDLCLVRRHGARLRDRAGRLERELRRAKFRQNETAVGVDEGDILRCAANGSDLVAVFSERDIGVGVVERKRLRLDCAAALLRAALERKLSRPDRAAVLLDCTGHLADRHDAGVPGFLREGPVDRCGGKRHAFVALLRHVALHGSVHGDRAAVLVDGGRLDAVGGHGTAVHVERSGRDLAAHFDVGDETIVGLLRRERLACRVDGAGPDGSIPLRVGLEGERPGTDVDVRGRLLDGRGDDLPGTCVERDVSGIAGDSRDAETGGGGDGDVPRSALDLERTEGVTALFKGDVSTRKMEGAGGDGAIGLRDIVCAGIKGHLSRTAVGGDAGGQRDVAGGRKGNETMVGDKTGNLVIAFADRSDRDGLVVVDIDIAIRARGVDRDHIDRRRLVEGLDLKPEALCGDAAIAGNLLRRKGNRLGGGDARIVQDRAAGGLDRDALRVRQRAVDEDARRVGGRLLAIGGDGRGFRQVLSGDGVDRDVLRVDGALDADELAGGSLGADVDLHRFLGLCRRAAVDEDILAARERDVPARRFDGGAVLYLRRAVAGKRNVAAGGDRDGRPVAAADLDGRRLAVRPLSGRRDGNVPVRREIAEDIDVSGRVRNGDVAVAVGGGAYGLDLDLALGRVGRLADVDEFLPRQGDILRGDVVFDLQRHAGHRHVVLVVLVGRVDGSRPPPATGLRLLVPDAGDGAARDDGAAVVRGIAALARAGVAAFLGGGILGDVERDGGAIGGGGDREASGSGAAEGGEGDLARADRAGVLDGLADEIGELARVDRALVDDAPRAELGEDHPVRAVLEGAHGGGNEAVHVHLRGGAEEDAVGVEDVDLVAGECAEDVGADAARHLVDGRAGTREADGEAVADAEVGPVAGGVGEFDRRGAVLPGLRPAVGNGQVGAGLRRMEGQERQGAQEDGGHAAAEEPLGALFGAEHRAAAGDVEEGLEMALDVDEGVVHWLVSP